MPKPGLLHLAHLVSYLPLAHFWLRGEPATLDQVLRALVSWPAKMTAPVTARVLRSTLGPFPAPGALLAESAILGQVLSSAPWSHGPQR